MRLEGSNSPPVPPDINIIQLNEDDYNLASKGNYNYKESTISSGDNTEASKTGFFQNVKNALSKILDSFKSLLSKIFCCFKKDTKNTDV